MRWYHRAVPPLVRARGAAAALCVVVILAGARGVAAQVPSQTVVEADRLRDAGQFVDAVRILEAHLASNGDDVLAARRLAQTLYWMKDLARAREVYERGLQRHPEDGPLRIEYAHMLLESGDRRRARALVAPLRTRVETRAAASALLGTAAYWDGDYTAAMGLFREAIEAGSTDPQVRRDLQDLRILSAPWVQIAPALLHDDQPLDRDSGRVAAGWFLTPLVPLRLRVDWQRYRADDVRQTVMAGEVDFGAYVPAARLDLDAALGVVGRRAAPGSDVTGRVRLGVRLGHGVSLAGRVERVPYFRTAASVAGDVSVTTAGLQLSIGQARGWLGDVAIDRHRFFDGNDVRSAHAWLLIPFVNRSTFGLQAGYAFAASDSDDLRFVLPGRDLQVLLAAPATSGLGRYDPYYTPIDQRSHAVLAAVRVSSGRSALRLSGSVGVRAEEGFPFFYLDAGVPSQGIGHRRLTPWSGRVATEVRVTDRLAVDISGEAGRSAFYQWVSAGLQLTYRFAPRVLDAVPAR